MASFANSVMSVLLSWVSAIASALWGFFSPDAQGNSLLSWFSENWWILVLILLAVCVAVDLLVYFLRWRPYRVWSTFFRHLRGKYESDLLLQREHHQSLRRNASDAQVRRWVYADGSAKEEILLPQGSDRHVIDEQANFSNTDAERFQEQPNEPAAEVSEPAPRRRRSTELHPEAPAKRPSRLHRLLSDDEQQQSFRYQPAPSAGTREEKFNGPYYPPQYVKPGENTNRND